MLANAAGDVRAVSADTALRVLSLVGAFSDCSRLSTFLVQLMRHPSPQVRSKAALLLGRSNLNLSRIKSFLASDDARLRANVLESMWGYRDPRLVSILWEATKDKHGRVAINALVGLCRMGERDAYDRLKELAGSTEAAVRAGAAWAMGELGETEFAGPLSELMKDGEENVRSMAAKSLKRLPVAAEALA
jgi:HEAT repeat protein